MDPDATLTELRELTAEINEGLGMRGDRAERMAELFGELDFWLMGGGFLPKSWQRAKEEL